MPLILPKWLAEGLSRPPMPRLMTYVTFSQVTGRPCAVPDLTHTLGRLRRSDVIRWLCSLAWWVEGPEGKEDEHQRQLAEQLLTAEQRRGLQAFLAREPHMRRVIFHRRQMWFLLQFAVSVCRDDTPETGDEELLHAIGECGLMANDLLSQTEPGGGQMGKSPNEVNHWLAAMGPALMVTGAQAEVLGRAWSLWFEQGRSEAIRKKCGEMDVPLPEEAFRGKYGLTLSEFFQVLLMVNTAFMSHAEKSSQPLLLDPTIYLGAGYPREQVEGVLKLIAQSPDELALRLFREPRQNWALDFTPLRARPLIEVQPGKFGCPDLELLYRCVLDRVLYLLNDAYPDKKFGQLFGYLFEGYVTAVIRQFTNESAILAATRTFYAAPRFKGGNDQAADGLIDRGGSVFLLEYKARSLTTRERYAGVGDATHEGIAAILYKDGSRGKGRGVAQLAKNLKRLLAGERIVAGPGEGVSFADRACFVPMLVAYEEAVANEAVRQLADAKFRESLKKEGVADPRIGPLLVLAVDDIELLECVAQKDDMGRLLDGYIEHIRLNPKDRLGNFRTFVRNRSAYAPDSGGTPFVLRQAVRALQHGIDDASSRNPD